ncbi:MAG: polyprenol monophosphomannose synthase [Candidatus Levybacteria bacterium]|nr:polyprenol monophosphomannose synthase [Candidatus Levybacteria bacterium]
MKKSVVVIPTYNSKKSITRTIRGVLKHMPKTKIIIVDDNSPDGTSEEVKKHFHEDKRISLIIRKQKGGRGSAVIKGFQEGLKNKNNNFFVEMDADLCHHPMYIPILIEKCQKFEVAITSKYLKDSKIIGLNAKRLLFSKLVNFYIKTLLRVPISDYTNGFRCYSRKALEKINFNKIKSQGFIVLSEIIYNIHKNGGSIGEVPFVFKYYNINPSNFNSREISEAFFTILRLKFNSK